MRERRLTRQLLALSTAALRVSVLLGAIACREQVIVGHEAAIVAPASAGDGGGTAPGANEDAGPGDRMQSRQSGSPDSRDDDSRDESDADGQETEIDD